MRAAFGIPLILSRQDRRQGWPRGPAPGNPCGHGSVLRRSCRQPGVRVCAVPGAGWNVCCWPQMISIWHLGLLFLVDSTPVQTRFKCFNNKNVGILVE